MSTHRAIDKPHLQTYQISKEMLEMLDKVPAGDMYLEKKFTPEEDAIILQYFHKKNKVALAKMLGICSTTLRRRYNILKESEEET